MKFRRVVCKLMLATMGLTTAGLGAATAVATPASATVYNIDSGGTLGGYTKCVYWYQCLTYAANESGAYMGTNSNIPNLCGSSVCYYFNEPSTGGSGFGDVVRNDAHSMENGYLYESGCDVETWYSPNYGGNANVLEGDWMNNLNAELVNNEASTKMVLSNGC
jgi:hypothetical protein